MADKKNYSQQIHFSVKSILTVKGPAGDVLL